MNKNTIIGLVLIGCILFGVSFYQSKQFEKRAEVQREDAAKKKEMQVDAMVSIGVDSVKRAEAGNATDAGAAVVKEASAPSTAGNTATAATLSCGDASLDAAAAEDGVIIRLRNENLDIELTTKGAQPYSVKLLNYKAYQSDSLVLVRRGSSDYGMTFSTGDSLKIKKLDTRKFAFRYIEQESSDTCAVMRLCFDNGAYIQQKYYLPSGSYMLYNELSFSGIDRSLLSHRTSLFDMAWKLVMPRLEKGYKNEKQYSKLNVYCPGDDKPEVIGKGGKDDGKDYSSQIQWFDFSQQFFSAILTSSECFASGDFSISFSAENDAYHNLMTCGASLKHKIALTDGAGQYNYEFYFGPNDYSLLKQYDRSYEKTITIGGSLIGLITRFVIMPSFRWLSSWISNYGIIILVMTFLLKLIISPLTMKSYMSSAKMNALRPELNKLNEKFPKANTDKSEAMKKQRATMDLYRRAGVNPAGGCLPMLLTFPLLWAMFRFFPVSIELRQQPFLWAEDLSTYDSICDFGFSFFGMNHLSLFALLMAVTMWFYSKMTMPPSDDPQMKPMRFMSVWLMPIMMFFICNSLSAGLSYYYLLSNLFMMVQNFIIKKWIVKPEKILAQIEANRNKPLPKSKWQMRLEEAQKMAEQQQRAKNKGRR